MGRVIRTEPRRGYAIAIGLNELDLRCYPGWKQPLLGCENDARDIADLASRVGFATTTLLGSSATRQRVLDDISAAARELKPADILLVFFSGHGSQLPDLNGDETVDKKDETWCLYDGELVDDELYHLWCRFDAGVRILVISDSCCSGTVAQQLIDALASSGGLQHADALPRFKTLRSDVADAAYEQDKQSYDQILTQPLPNPGSLKASVLLLAACQDNQLASDGDPNSLFTDRLNLVWNDGRFSGTYRDFHSAILSKMPPSQTPNLDTTSVLDPSFLEQRPFAR